MNICSYNSREKLIYNGEKEKNMMFRSQKTNRYTLGGLA